MKTSKFLAKRPITVLFTLAALIVLAAVGLVMQPARAQFKTAPSIAEAQAELAQAIAAAKGNGSKETSRFIEEKLRAYNDAVAARRAEIKARLTQLSAALPPPVVSSPFDSRGGKIAPSPQRSSKEFQDLNAELAQLPPELLRPGNVFSMPESEPNNTAGTATALGAMADSRIAITGSITAADVDFFSFTVPAGAKVWAYIDTGGGQSSPTNDRDSFMTLFNTDGTTVIEEDDDDGTGNGGDSVTESTFASNIAGRTVGAAGTYFIAVEGFGPTSVISPYTLFVTVTTGAAAAEGEPNGSSATANSVLASGATIGRRAGSITPAGDVDFYSVVANTGDVFFIQGDGNPERDATNVDLVIDFVAPDGRSLMVPPTDSGLGGSPTNPEGEAFNFAVPASGTYFVRVSGFGTSTGTYELMVSRSNTALPCPPPIITGVLGQAAPNKITGTQNGRLNRFVDQTGACNNVRTCPGQFTTAGARPYDAYQFKNSSAMTACATVDFDAQACTVNNFLVVAAYLGTYDPANQCANYLADMGGSPNPVGSFSFNIPAGQTVTIVVTAANASPTVCGTAYRFSVVGVDCFDTCIQDDKLRRFLQLNQTTGAYLFNDCSKNIVASGTGGASSYFCKTTYSGSGPNSSVQSLFNPCTARGDASVNVAGKSYPIADSNIFNNTCSCTQ